jgi:hypothetical protein
MLALCSCLVGNGCDKKTVRLLVDTTLASCSEPTVFLSSWWSSLSSDVELDPIGGALLVYWVDESGNACHGTPGTSGQPGPIELTAFDPGAATASGANLYVTTAQLEDFQEIAFNVTPYAASGLHFVQHANYFWRLRRDGKAYRMNIQFSVPAVVSMDRSSFCVSAVQTTEPECATSMMPLPSLFPGSGQHASKCKTRFKPTVISPTIEARLDSCAPRLPHGLEVSTPL